MRNILEKFKGQVVRITFNNTLVLPKIGILEIDDDWAFLYRKIQTNKKYEIAFKINSDIIETIVLVK